MASVRDRLSDNDIPDIYTCMICMEHLLDRNPRFLSCHHYFCQSCLRRLIKKSRISCPTCRAITKVTDNDVTTLTMNAVLVQVMEREQYIKTIRDKLLEFPPQSNCEICTNKKPVNKCNECDKMFCESCTTDHNKMEPYKAHNLIRLCQNHFDGISHICMKCLKGVCIKCIVLDHEDHEDLIEKYSDAIKYLKSNLRKMHMDIPGRITKIEKSLKDIEADRERIGKERTDLQNERDKLVKQIENMDKKISNLTDEGTACFDWITTSNEQRRTYVQLSHYTKKLYKSTDRDEDILSKYIQVKQTMETLRKETDNMDTNSSASTIPEEEIKWLPKPKLIKVVNEQGRHKLQYPNSIRMTRDNRLIYSDNIVDIFTILDDTYQVETTFSTHSDSVRSVDVYKNQIYLAQSKQIYCIQNYNSQNESWDKYNPDINDIYKIAVVNDDLILITEYFAGKLFAYDPNQNTTKIILDNLNKPSYINVARTESGIRYVLSLQCEVNIYDDCWRLISSLSHKKGALKEPRDTAAVPGGVLVADYKTNKITLFNYTGKLIRHILTYDNGISQPASLVFNSPLLWVAQGYRQNAALKCYKLLDNA